MPIKRGRIAAVIGSCFAISWPGAFIFGFPGVMAQHWQNAFHASRGDVGRTVFFILAAVGVFMFFTGRWQERVGPRPLAALGMLLCAGSTLMIGYASSIRQVYVWGFIMGVSSSFIYIPAITVVQRWYPLRKGFVSGLVSMAFGLSAAVMSPVFNTMLLRLGTGSMAFILCILTVITGLASIPFIRFPQAECVGKLAQTVGQLESQNSLDVSGSVKTRAFWFLWLTWALGGAAGIAMVTLSTSYGVAKGLSVEEAVFILTAFNLTNGVSRLVSGYLSDIIGRNTTMSLAFLASGCAYLLMLQAHNLFFWAIFAGAIGFAFGTLFAVSAPLVSDCFGMKHFGVIFGLVFTAYGFFAGALGPWLSGHLLDISKGDFSFPFMYLGLFSFASAFFTWFARPPAEASTPIAL